MLRRLFELARISQSHIVRSRIFVMSLGMSLYNVCGARNVDMTAFPAHYLIHALRAINSDNFLSEHVFDILVAKRLKYQF